MGLIQNKVTVSQPNSHVIVKNAGGLRGLTGEQGIPGPQGEPGEAATVTAGTTTTLPAGSDATVQNVGSTSDAIFNFGIPQGEKGDTGDTGAAATIEVGSTTTLPTGQDATVTNSGTSSAAVLNFGIPRGPQGEDGPQGFSPSASVSKTGDTATITITDKDGTTTAQITDGVTPTVDDELSPTSENPVQNKVVTNALAGKQPSFQIVDELPAEGVEGSEYLVDEAYETITQLQGNIEQTTIPGDQLLTKQGMATPETDTAFWAALTSTKITKTDKSDGWANIEQNATGFGNFNIKRAGVANFEVSTVYTLIVELKNVSGSGTIGLIQTTQTNDPYASYTVVQGASASSGGNAQINIANPDLVSVLKVTTKSSFASATQGFRGFTRDNVSVGSKFDIRVSIILGDHSTDWQNYVGNNWKPFVGGITSPNPDYPQAVQTVTGRQAVYVAGKNLAKPYQTSGSITANGVTLTMNNNGSITLDGTATGNSWLEFVGDFTSSPTQLYTPTIPLDKNETYTLSYSIASGSVSGGTPSIWLQYDTPEDSSTRETSISITASGNSKSFTGKTGVYRMWVRSSSGHKYDNLVLQPQVERGPVATNFEPYQGQTYEINLGKNLLDNYNPTVVSANTTWAPTANGGLYTATSNWTGGVKWRFTVEEGATYQFHYKERTSQNLYLYIVTYTDATYTTIKTRFVNDGRQITYSIVPNSPYLEIYFQNSSAITDVAIEELMFEKGPVATTYASYFTPIELCKIGDYQDYIYKSGEDWYVHKAIRRYNFTGSETVAVSNNNRANFQNIFNNDKFVGAGGGYCDHAKYNPVQTQVSASLQLGEFALQNYQDANYNFIMRLPNDSYTVAQVQQWFIDNPTTVYYPLETPTDTQITNADLIAQLNALNAVAIKHYNTVAVSSPNLPASLVIVQGANSHLEPYVYYNGKFEKVQIV